MAVNEPPAFSYLMYMHFLPLGTVHETAMWESDRTDIPEVYVR
jgi:hypothetical protein